MPGLRRWSVACVLGLAALSASCGSSGPVELRGAVQKGPFVVGSTVLVAELDDAGRATGAVFSTTTIDDLGTFTVAAPIGRPLRIEASGGYYNEVTGELSLGSLTLRAFRAGDADATTVYVNLVTHLSAMRVERLVRDGASFSAAVAQAESELRAALEIVPPSIGFEASGTEMDLAGGNSPGNAYLFGVSTVLAQAAIERTPASPDTGLQELANMIAIDLADDGAISSALEQFVAAGLLAVDTADVEESLGSRFALLGSTAVPPDLDAVLDQDRDLLVNRDDNCPRVANPGQEDADGDGRGDACASCAERPEACLGDPCDFEAGGGCDADEVCARFRASSSGDWTQSSCAEPCTIDDAGACAPGLTCAPVRVSDGLLEERGAFACVPDVGEAGHGEPCSELVHGECDLGVCLGGECAALCGRSGDPLCSNCGACGDGDGVFDLALEALALDGSRYPDLGMCSRWQRCEGNGFVRCIDGAATYCVDGVETAWGCSACGAAGCVVSCEPGEVVGCFWGAVSLVCSASGDALEVGRCEDGLACATEPVAGCRGSVCVPDDGYCAERVPGVWSGIRCDATGGAETIDECEPGRGCTDGLCEPCTPGSFLSCNQPDVAVICGPDGDSTRPVGCTGGRCPDCSICEPGTRLCEDDSTIWVCRTDGSGLDLVRCDPGTTCSIDGCI